MVEPLSARVFCVEIKTCISDGNVFAVIVNASSVSDMKGCLVIVMKQQ